MENRLQTSGNNSAIIDIDESRVEVIDHDRPSAGEQCCHYFRNFMQFLFSYVGLTAMLCGYLLFGAIVFRSIESRNEASLRVDIREEMEDIFGDLFREARRVGVKEVNWTSNAITRMVTQQKKYQVHSVVFLEYLDDGEKWSFFGAVLFSLTVLSTIGKFLKYHN